MFKRYLQFLKLSTNQHGVHSPFVFLLITKCIYGNSSKDIRKQFKFIYKSLKKNTTTLEVQDLGAGSRVFKSNFRKISKIASNVLTPLKYALLLNRLVAYFKVKQVLELGTSLGMSAHAICFQNHEVLLDTVEGCKETSSFAKQLNEINNTNHQINFINTDFNSFLNSNNKIYDLIYFDGDHTYASTIGYFEKCLHFKHNDSVFIFDDIYLNKEMTLAWEYVKNRQEVIVTIDLFKWGVVFFRKEMSKQHFKIRF